MTAALDWAAWQLVDAHARGELTNELVDDVMHELRGALSRHRFELSLVEPSEILQPDVARLYWRARLAEIDFENARAA